jgi:hypothetical protein
MLVAKVAEAAAKRPLPRPLRVSLVVFIIVFLPSAVTAPERQCRSIRSPSQAGKKPANNLAKKPQMKPF